MRMEGKRVYPILVFEHSGVSWRDDICKQETADRMLLNR
jgi:hypothetical protein